MTFTAIVLAGGLGRRMGGIDKGLVTLRGKAMVAHVLERLAPQVDELLVNANQNLERYAAFGYRVIPDKLPGYAGPLAGLQAGLSEASGDLVVTAPCDSPFLPLDLVARLQLALAEHKAQLAVAQALGQAYPVFCLCQRGLLPHLTAFLDAGGRKFDAWYADLKTVEVNFDDQADAFKNINTPQELAAEVSTPLLGFCASVSGAGKTTLLTRLIPLLVGSGLRISAIKHTHHDFDDIDQPGKDSDRLRKSGAVQVLLSAKHDLQELVADMDVDIADLIIIEGFKHAPIPKIEVYRPILEAPLLAEHDAHVIAIASDGEVTTSLPVLDLNDPVNIAAFITAWLRDR